MTRDERAPAGAREDPIEQLAEWERRLIRKARELKASKRRERLQVEFDGGDLTMWRLQPDGRVAT